MKTRTLFLLFIVLMASALTHAQSKVSPKLRHVVLFKFFDTSKPEDVKKVEDAFAALTSKIDLIKDFEWGTNFGSGNLNQGLTHCFLVTFSSEDDLNTYLGHPAHKAFLEVLKPQLDKMTIIDYWAKE